MWNQSLNVGEGVNLLLNKVFVNKRFWLWLKGSRGKLVAGCSLGSSFKMGVVLFGFFFLLWLNSLHLFCCHKIFLYLGQQDPSFHRGEWLSRAVAVRWAQTGQRIVSFPRFLRVAVAWECHSRSSPDQDFNCVNPRTLTGCTTWKSYNAKFHSTPSPSADQSSSNQLRSETGSKPAPSQVLAQSDREGA